ncbi:MAG: beta-ketoacyl synthase N-terminal-like domain-containing protein, partial [Cyclobacteriaceae bacterium]
MTFKRVVITGAGALTPIGNTLREDWDGLSQGKSGAAPITKFDTTLFKTKFACEVKGFDPTVLMERKEARKLDPFAQYAMAVADEAILD